MIDFCNREMSNVVLSLDGRKEVHDRFRVDYAGNGSWERIVPKFQKLVRARGGRNYYMRGTFTHQNPDFLEDIRTMLDLGFTELSMEPVVCAPGDPSALTKEDLEIVKRQYEELAELMLEREAEGRPFTFYHYMLDLSGGPCIYKRISGCGSGTEYMAVTPWGDLYPCHQFVGEERFRLGDIWNGLDNPEVRGEFAAYAATAGHGSTVPAAARPTPGMPPEASPACMKTAANCSASAWNARSCWRRPEPNGNSRADEYPDL